MLGSAELMRLRTLSELLRILRGCLSLWRTESLETKTMATSSKVSLQQSMKSLLDQCMHHPKIIQIKTIKWTRKNITRRIVYVYAQ